MKSLSGLQPLLFIIGLGFGLAPQGMAQGPTFIEFAPIKGAVGQLSLRGERFLTKKVAWGISYDDERVDGKRADVLDETKRLDVGVVWYPFGLAQNGFFLGAGVLAEQVVTGQQSPRDQSTWISPNADEMHDKWRREDLVIATSQGIGYRLNVGTHFTASLRYGIDEVFYSSAKIHRDRIYSGDPDLGAGRRAAVQQRVMFHVGLGFN